jgi:DNA invertase Pin-like site-specific DNA recombinase
MRLVGYVRVSSLAQKDSGASIEAQTEKVRAMAVVKGFPLMEIISDAGESAKDLERPGMQRLLAMVTAKQIDGIVVAKLDRVTRSVKDLNRLIETFRAKSVALISVEEALDMTTATGRMMVNLIGLFSQWEREIIGERTSAALQQIKRSGCPAGPPPYGYRAQFRPEVSVDGRIVKKRMPLLDEPAEQQTISLILKMHAEGESYRNMAKRLNEAGYRTRPAKSNGMKGGEWNHVAMGNIIKANTKPTEEKAA